MVPESKAVMIIFPNSFRSCISVLSHVTLNLVRDADLPSVIRATNLLLLLPLPSSFSRVRLCNLRWQPTRLACPWDSPGKNTGMGCHFLLQCMKVKSENEVAQSCPTLSDPMDCSPPGSSIHGICQARVLEWVAIAFSGYRIISVKAL